LRGVLISEGDVIHLTTNDRKMLSRARIVWPEPSAESLLCERLRARNAALIDEQAKLLRIQTQLIEQRDYWYRCCRRAIVAAALLTAGWAICEWLRSSMSVR